MKAKKYKIQMHAVHMSKDTFTHYAIFEIYVPELKLYVNRETSFIGEDDNRVQDPYQNIEVDSGVAGLLASAIKTKESAERRLKESLGLIE